MPHQRRLWLRFWVGQEETIQLGRKKKNLKEKKKLKHSGILFQKRWTRGVHHVIIV